MEFSEGENSDGRRKERIQFNIMELLMKFRKE